LSDADVALRLKAEGVGLYRSEFPFIVRNSFPSEEEQYRIYRKLIEKMDGRPVTLRTLDIGGDKMLSYFPKVNEANPFLGLRAIRFSLRNREIFSEQLLAMLRAGAGGEVGILFPLISSVDDFLEASAVVRECAEQLAAQDIPHAEAPALGVMMELPCAVEIAPELAREADMLCIGSNDLVQYTLAVDRTNPELADMYLSHHPAVLRAIKRIVDAAKSNETPVSICGDVVQDEKMLPFLLGIGVDTYSVNARFIPRVQKRIAQVDLAEATEHAEAMLRMSTLREIREYLEDKPGVTDS
jgi:phosphotransferase system enzyme I (PtsP)